MIIVRHPNSFQDKYGTQVDNFCKRLIQRCGKSEGAGAKQNIIFINGDYP